MRNVTSDQLKDRSMYVDVMMQCIVSLTHRMLGYYLKIVDGTVGSFHVLILHIDLTCLCRTYSFDLEGTSAGRRLDAYDRPILSTYAAETRSTPPAVTGLNKTNADTRGIDIPTQDLNSQRLRSSSLSTTDPIPVRTSISTQDSLHSRTSHTSAFGSKGGQSSIPDSTLR